MCRYFNHPILCMCDVNTKEIVSIPKDHTETFIVKAPDKLETGAGGMVRSSTEDKVDYSLILDGVMPLRWAQHLTKGAVHYGKRNWLKATKGAIDEMIAVRDRAMESLTRHFMQWYAGDKSEDHAAAMMFNINLFETVTTQIDKVIGDEGNT